jgi:hypothetical protein
MNSQIDTDIEQLNLEPPKLKPSCTGFNCICWKKGIYKFCEDPKYNMCMICYDSTCIRSKKGHTEPCNIRPGEKESEKNTIEPTFFEPEPTISKPTISKPTISKPTIFETCTGFNCVCWKRGINNFCADPKYNTCMICYNSNCIRSKKGHKEKCNILYKI